MAKETSHCGGRRRLRLFLSNRRFAEAVDKSVDLSATLKPEEVAEMKEIAFSSIILCLVYYVLPQINDAKTVKQVWAQLDAIYLTKSVSNKLYIKERFFGFKMDSSKDLEHNLDEFNRILLDLM